MRTATQTGLLISVLLSFKLSIVTCAIAETIDPHRLYEDQCSGCHAAHAGEFVHGSLDYSRGGAIGRKTSKGLRAFLTEGHGGLNAQQIDALLDLFLGINTRGRVYHDKCRICHDRATELARSRLIIIDGRLMGRYSGRDIEEFLSRHGRLEGREVEMMTQTLESHVRAKGN
jgi:cytochrome c5